jgi:Bacterial protein of unknown function (DUF853)
VDDESGIFVGLGGGRPQRLVLSRANRHGLIAGATGTGKTVTLQGLVEGFSSAGVPVFVADVKGDLGGLAMAGSPLGEMHDAFAAPPRSATTNGPIATIRSSSGTCSASRAIRSGPPSPKWAR